MDNNTIRKFPVRESYNPSAGLDYTFKHKLVLSQYRDTTFTNMLVQCGTLELPISLEKLWKKTLQQQVPAQRPVAKIEEGLREPSIMTFIGSNYSLYKDPGNENETELFLPAREATANLSSCFVSGHKLYVAR